MAENIVVVGGGAAGMMCAALAAAEGAKVVLFEQNEKLGKKLFITGKGRCNFTNDCPPAEYLEHVLTNPRFLYSSIYEFTPADVIAKFEEWGMKTKVERGRRAFPLSDHSSDVIDTLKIAMRKGKVKVFLRTKVEEILAEDGHITGVVVSDEAGKRTVEASKVVIASGGLSYPSTGSTGDGFLFAKQLGHKVTATSPSLVPIVCAEEYIREMQGLSLKNVELHVKSGKKEVFDEFGEMMFTHFGITGPLVLSASASIGTLIGKKELKAWIDLKPAVTEEMLDQRLLKLFAANPNRQLRNVLGELYPAKMVPVIPLCAGVDDEKRVHDVTKQERRRLIETTKHFPLTLEALRGYNEAVITRGGVAVKEVDPSTMESKLISGLYFIGEVLDLDAYTGGYNLQIAWSTAYACARALSCS